MEGLRKILSATAAYQNLQQEGDARYGPISGVDMFKIFQSRDELRKSHVHNQERAGIAGNASDGAYSIVVSHGYADDVDEGEFISYAGAGGKGNDEFSHNRNLTADQTFEHTHNRALQRSAETGRPVRVIRGHNSPSKYAPLTGYRYDGLYRVEKAYMAKSKSGFQVCKFDLRRLPGQPALPVKPGM